MVGADVCESRSHLHELLWKSIMATEPFHPICSGLSSLLSALMESSLHFPLLRFYGHYQNLE